MHKSHTRLFHKSARHTVRLSKSQGYFADLSLSAYKGTVGLKAAKSDKQQVIFDVSPAVKLFFALFAFLEI